jgi:glycogen synthase
VIAYAAGGALDTVIDGETGVHFRQQTPQALVDAVRGAPR